MIFAVKHIKFVNYKLATKKGKGINEMKKINDFGAKIGGAKKDLWAFFKSLSAEEQNEMAVKAKLWPRPRYEALAAKGIPEEVLFWRNQMRKAVKARPETNAEEYMKFCTTFRDVIDACENMDNIHSFYVDGITPFMKKIDDGRWKYASKTTKPFFDGIAVLRYLNHDERIISDFNESTFMNDSAEKEAKKYNIIEATGDNLQTTPYGASRFANRVTLPDCIHIFYDVKRYDLLLENCDKIFIALYDKNRIGVYDKKEDAEKAVETHKKNKADAKNAQKKDAFLPPHLSSIERTGSNYKYFRMSDGNVLLARYGLRGGEFGNYTTSKDRLGAINMAYDAFEDLYKVLGVSPKDMSLGGNLAIAFGARGRGSAMAHYEPEKNVINMTKFRGAGSLAHEWAHALDTYLGKRFGVHGFMSANVDSDEVPESAKALVTAFTTAEDGGDTYFYTASQKFDKNFKKSGNGYWASSHEMFARAFACYVKDRLDGRKSDYLVGHADCATDGVDFAFPVGEERKIIDEKFDAFFKDMLESGIFSPEKKKKEDTTTEESEVFVIFEDGEGQLKFC